MNEKEKQDLLVLIKQAQEGEQSAFTKLYNSYRATVYSTILQVVNNTDVADDLTSVTFTKAFLKIGSYVNHISFGMWLKTIAINTSIDYIRKTKKEAFNRYIDDSDSTFQLEDAADWSPEDSYVFSETDARIKDAMSRLRFKYRNILSLRISEDLSYKEIGDRLGISESQVKSTLNKAREKLKNLLT